MPQATTPTQQAIIDHFNILKDAGSQFWFVIQIGWVRDLGIKDGMSANEGFCWTEALLNSAKAAA